MSDPYFLHDIKNHIHNLSLFFKTRIKNKLEVCPQDLILLDKEADALLEIIGEEEIHTNYDCDLDQNIPLEFLDETINHFLEMNNITVSYDQRSINNQGNINGTKAIMIRCIENICRNIFIHSKNNHMENIKYINSDQYIILETSSFVGNMTSEKLGLGKGLKSVSKILKLYDSYIYNDLQKDLWLTRIYFKKSHLVKIDNLKAA